MEKENFKTLMIKLRNCFNENRIANALEFQVRIYDLVWLDSTPVIEKIRFLKIISSNLEELIQHRFLYIQQYEARKITQIAIEEIYRMIKDTLIELNKKYEISEINEPYNDFKKELLCNSISPAYCGENDYEKYVDITKIFSGKKDQALKIIVLESDDKDRRVSSVNHIYIPKEIFLLESYEKKYIENYPDQVYQKEKIKIETVDFYSELMDGMDYMFRVPFISYNMVLNFIDNMCKHPEITSIFITLYRINKFSSKIIQSLLTALKLEKNVWVYIEISARGDELNNLKAAKNLIEEGANVNVSYFDYKIHAKMFLAVCEDGRKFVHIGTGNYNEETAKTYTDLHLLSYRSIYTEPVFQIMMSIFYKKHFNFNKSFTKIFFSPTSLRTHLIEKIIEEGKKEKNGRIWIKCNHITDSSIMNELRAAAVHGAEIKILCRTSCDLLPQDRMEIRSKVGRYLEHDRFYIFGNEGYISSADLMYRNLSKRVELLVNVEFVGQLENLFESIWFDDTIHIMGPDGSWGLA